MTTRFLVDIIVFLIGVLVGIFLIKHSAIGNEIIFSKEFSVYHILILLSVIFVGLHLSDSFKKNKQKDRTESELLIKTLEEIKGYYTRIYDYFERTNAVNETRFDEAVNMCNNVSFLVSDYQNLIQYGGHEKKMKIEVKDIIDLNKKFKANLTDTETKDNILFYTSDRKLSIQEGYFDLVHSINASIVKVNRVI